MILIKTDNIKERKNTVQMSTLPMFIVASLLLVLPVLTRGHSESEHHTQHHDAGHQCINKYGGDCQPTELSDKEMFKRGHMKPFGSHRPPDKLTEELPFMISSEDFYMNYVIKHKPVVFKGVAKNWPAYTKWTDEYLGMMWRDTKMHMETKDDDKYNFPPTMTLGEFITQYKKSNLYLVDEVTPEMRKDVVLPLCLRCEEISKYFFVSYIWMSMGNTSSKIHIDTDENLLCVIHGHKQTIMVSPEYSNDLYSDDGRLLGVSNIDPQAVDMKKYPRVKNVRYEFANMSEGDCLYLPQMWWHQVISPGPLRQQAVALWWKSKPWWKEMGRKAPPMKPETLKIGSPDRKYSFGGLLAQYEKWVQEVTKNTPRIKCKMQQSFMSEYHFETDHVKDAPMSLGDGGDIEEKKTMEGLPEAEGVPEGGRSCDFDRNNKKSPCHYKQCYDDNSNPSCIRYMLDYCLAFSDRGCIIQLPQALNKLTDDEYNEIQTMKSDFVP